MLSEQEEELVYEKEYKGSGENVIKTVLLGKADAGVLLNVVLNKAPQEELANIREIMGTDEIPSHPLAAHPRVPAAVQKTVQQAVLEIGSTPEGSNVLKNIRMPSPVTTDYAKEYQRLEGVEVKTISNWGS